MQSVSPNNDSCRRVVVVDDDTELLNLVANTLQDTYSIARASSYAELDQILDDFTPDIAIVDVHLPGQDGFACINKLKEKNNNIMTIVMSGFISRQKLFQGIRAHVFDYIEKPFNFETLVGGVEQARRDVLSRSHFHNSVEPSLHGIVNVGLNTQATLMVVKPILKAIKLLLLEQTRSWEYTKTTSHDQALLVEINRQLSLIKSEWDQLEAECVNFPPFFDKTSISTIAVDCLEQLAPLFNHLGVQAKAKIDPDIIGYCDYKEMTFLVTSMVINAIGWCRFASPPRLTVSASCINKELVLNLTTPFEEGREETLLSAMAVKRMSDLTSEEKVLYKIANKYNGHLFVSVVKEQRIISVILPLELQPN